MKEKRSPSKEINIDYLARTEGEANVKAVISDGEVEHLELDIWEPPRYFEGFLVGRMFYEVPDLASRICGICPVSHMTTAFRAVEAAMSVRLHDLVKDLRKLMAASQVAASHVIHLYMLALPDYTGHDSIIAMMPQYRREVERALRLKAVLNDITAAVGGRGLHPMRTDFNGFTDWVTEKTLLNLSDRLKEVKADAIETVKLFAALPVLDFDSEIIDVALQGQQEYPLNEGVIKSSNGLEAGERDYRNHFHEEQVSHSNTKRSTIDELPFRVGALSRVNLNFERLSADAKAIAEEVSFVFPNRNPYNVNMAQAIELVNSIDVCLELLNSLKPRPLPKVYRVKSGTGAAVTEAPRGLLYHSYQINGDGLVEKADIATPTSHNSFALETDLRSLLLEVNHLEVEEIKKHCEQLVRAYDPCFSCSVHIIRN